MSSNIENLRLVRRVLGFAKIGTLLHASVVKSACDAFEEVSAQPGQAPQSMAKAAAALRSLDARIMPAAATCADGMNEIDVYLLPLRQDARSAPNQPVTPVPRARA